MGQVEKRTRKVKNKIINGKKEVKMNISIKGIKKKHRVMMVAVFFSLCAWLYFISTATAGVSESGVKCRVEIDRAVLPGP